MIEIKTSSYNERRYGKPYIALVNFTDPNGTPAWGNWIGQPGDAGLLLIDAQPGDIIMRGQKDNRGSGSAPSYWQVCSDGTVDWIETKADAYKAWQAAQAAPQPDKFADFSTDDLIAELRTRGVMLNLLD